MQKRLPNLWAAVPSWQLSPVFPSINSKEFEAALSELSLLLNELNALAAAPPAQEDSAACGEWLGRVIAARHIAQGLSVALFFMHEQE